MMEFRRISIQIEKGITLHSFSWFLGSFPKFSTLIIDHQNNLGMKQSHVYGFITVSDHYIYRILVASWRGERKTEYLWDVGNSRWEAWLRLGKFMTCGWRSFKAKLSNSFVNVMSLNCAISSVLSGNFWNKQQSYLQFQLTEEKFPKIVQIC